MKVGVIINSHAGGGGSRQRVIKALAHFFKEDQLLTANAEAISEGLRADLMIPVCEGTSYYDKIYRQVETLVSHDVDCLVTVGGDGMAAYVCTALYEIGKKLPVFGVGTGTANVGPVVSAAPDQLLTATSRDLREKCCDGLLLYVDGHFVSCAYNDAVIGNTFLATVEGKAVNASAQRLLEDHQVVPVEPDKTLMADGFSIKADSVSLQLPGHPIVQAILSTTDARHHYGRAIYGALGKGGLQGKNGVIALCDHIAVTFSPDDTGLSGFSSTSHFLFSEHQEIEISGCSEKAYLICDGNPYPLGRSTLQVRYVRNLLQVLKIEETLK